MQLTLYTDYSLRALIYLAIHDDRSVTISEIAEFYRISRNHLVKVIHNLSTTGFIDSTRGKGGGLRLSKPPREITVGEIVRKTEPNFHVVECFNTDSPLCVIDPVCALKPILFNAMESFLAELDRCTIADLVRKQPNTDASISPVKFIR